jgi:hypothetical protein
MAFIRKRMSSRSSTCTVYSFQFIETYRAEGKVRQRVLCNIGAFRSAAQAASARWAINRLPALYREEILHRLEAMAREEPAADDVEALEALERRIAAALRK